MSNQEDTWGGMFWVRETGIGWRNATPGEACDEIERLRAENARLRGLMRETVKWWDWWQADTTDRCASMPDDRINDMREALEEKP